MNHRTRLLTTLALLLLAIAAHARTVTYVYTDSHGTPLAEADVNGNITAQFDYTPYGKPIASMGATPDGPGYTGHVNDPDTGFVYMQARYYDPSVGRFLSVDPVRNSPGNIENVNAYSYASDNPIIKFDPSGMYTCEGSSNNCDKVDGFISTLKSSLGNLKKGSDEYNKLARVVYYYGDKNSNKSIIIKVVDSAKSGEIGDASAISMPSIANTAATFGRYSYNKNMKSNQVLDATGAAVLAHEGRHRLDMKSFDPTSSKRAYMRSEVNAERTESAAYQATGLATGLWWPGATAQEINANIQTQSSADTATWCLEATVCN